ncbi:hypothetical protein B0T21DRAFT_401195 [Apiosordaria backusii]|uniref:Uncharacterized protein n=1 Tax=Apiosordaria backusii TaxID=314023 RepID=A0AA40BMT6_9PEZI|nr:hypothetical protein B0T21DRAFT_401195 [Apiosordaria backusii]
MVFRGEDCVSLGWCFWHKACYGCLFCGCKIVVRGVGLKELFEGSGGDEEERAKEVDTVPMCINCLVDMQDQVVKRALRKVERNEGGLARGRWEELRRGYNEKRIHLHRRVNGDGARSDFEEGGDQGVGGEGVIYVSLSDPLGEMSFRPSPTKGIPSFLQPLGASSVQSSHQVSVQKQQESQIRRHNVRSYSSRASNNSHASTVRLEDKYSSASDGNKTQSHHSQISEVLSLRHTPPTGSQRRFLHRGTSFVSEQPLTLPSSLIQKAVGAEDSLSNNSTTFSAYGTPPEYPSPPVSSSGRHSRSSGADDPFTTTSSDPRLNRATSYNLSPTTSHTGGGSTRQYSSNDSLRSKAGNQGPRVEGSTMSMHIHRMDPKLSSDFLQQAYQSKSSPQLTPSTLSITPITPPAAVAFPFVGSTSSAITSDNNAREGFLRRTASGKRRKFPRGDDDREEETLMAKIAIRKNSLATAAAGGAGGSAVKAEPSTGRVQTPEMVATTTRGHRERGQTIPAGVLGDSVEGVRGRDKKKGGSGGSGGSGSGNGNGASSKRRSVQAELRRFFGR